MTTTAITLLLLSALIKDILLLCIQLCVCSSSSIIIFHDLCDLSPRTSVHFTDTALLSIMWFCTGAPCGLHECTHIVIKLVCREVSWVHWRSILRHISLHSRTASSSAVCAEQQINGQNPQLLRKYSVNDSHVRETADKWLRGFNLSRTPAPSCPRTKLTNVTMFTGQNSEVNSVRRTLLKFTYLTIMTITGSTMQCCAIFTDTGVRCVIDVLNDRLSSVQNVTCPPQLLVRSLSQWRLSPRGWAN